MKKDHTDSWILSNIIDHYKLLKEPLYSLVISHLESTWVKLKWLDTCLATKPNIKHKGSNPLYVSWLSCLTHSLLWRRKPWINLSMKDVSTLFSIITHTSLIMIGDNKLSMMMVFLLVCREASVPTQTLIIGANLLRGTNYSTKKSFKFSSYALLTKLAIDEYLM